MIKLSPEWKNEIKYFILRMKLNISLPNTKQNFIKFSFMYSNICDIIYVCVCTCDVISGMKK